MDKTVAGILGAVGALMAAAPSQAAVQPASAGSVLEAVNYSDLLRPIPNALATLRTMDEPNGPVGGEIEQVQVILPRVIIGGGHHHHHHHRYYRRRYHHHHHHHHHHGYYR